MSKIQEQDLKKLYYSIGEVGKLFDVNTSLIRFWEKEFTSVNPKKNKKGNRLFTPKDILKIEKIYILVKEKGYTLDGAKKALKNKETDYSSEEITASNDNSEVISKLESLRMKLVGLKS